ncbi:MAG: hypothetical protein Q7S87_07690 [Agitococcus sp.]|nr:hypothetical protein [Agitococcus sp.]MDO9177729.1 hypothetical protein [Agitococcus sp.]
MKQSIRLYSLIGFSLLLMACGRSQQEQQAEAERVSQEYQKKIEAEEKALEEGDGTTSTTPFKLPPRPEDTPEPVGPPPNVEAMTNPELVAQELASKDAQQRLAAVKRLGFLSAQNKIPDVALQRLINTYNADADASVVDAAARALGQTCHPAAILVLFNNLQRSIADVNVSAVVVLGDFAGFRASEALDTFVENLDDAKTVKSAQLRTEAAAAKAKILARNGSSICPS